MGTQIRQHTHTHTHTHTHKHTHTQTAGHTLPKRHINKKQTPPTGFTNKRKTRRKEDDQATGGVLTPQHSTPQTRPKKRQKNKTSFKMAHDRGSRAGRQFHRDTSAHPQAEPDYSRPWKLDSRPAKQQAGRLFPSNSTNRPTRIHLHWHQVVAYGIHLEARRAPLNGF